MSAWLQGFLIGAAFGLLLGMSVTLVLARVDRRERRPGYIQTTSFTAAPPHGPRIPGLDERTDK